MTTPAEHAATVSDLRERLDIALTWVPTPHREGARRALAALAERADELERLLHGPDRVGQMWKRAEAAERRAEEAEKALREANDKLERAYRYRESQEGLPDGTLGYPSLAAVPPEEPPWAGSERG